MVEKPTILFDLDGTLVDSAPDIALAINKSLVKNKLNPVDEGIVKTFIGNGSQALVSAILSRKRNVKDWVNPKKIHKDFIEAYRRVFFFYSRVYPQVTASLCGLAKHFNLVCLTNKPGEIVRPILIYTKLSRYFQIVIAGNTLNERKPSPAGIFFSAEKLKCNTRNMVMIGDSNIDIETARSAKIPAIGVNYGYSNGKDLAEEGATATVDRFNEIPPLLDRLLDKNK